MACQAHGSIDMALTATALGLCLSCLQVPYISKPWAYLCSHPHRATFYEYLSTTPWAGKNKPPLYLSIAAGAMHSCGLCSRSAWGNLLFTGQALPTQSLRGHSAHHRAAGSNLCKRTRAVKDWR